MEEKDNCSGGWLNSWFQVAKEKSAVALDFVKKDLSEFSTTVQTDSKHALTNVKDNLNQENVNAATQKAKAGVSGFLGEITKVLTIEAEDLHSPTIPKPSSQPIFDRAKARLNAIQLDEGTYMNEPSGSVDDFLTWQSTFVLESRKGEISELLVSHVQVRSLYTQLVPSSVSHADFWQRYFYKLHALQLDEARRAALKKRAEDSSANLQAWDDADDTDDWVDMSGPSSPPADSHMSLDNLHIEEARSEVVSEQSNDHVEIKPTAQRVTNTEEDNIETIMDDTSSSISSSAAVVAQTSESVKKDASSIEVSAVVDAGAASKPSLPEICAVLADQTPDSGSDSSIVVVRSEDLLSADSDTPSCQKDAELSPTTGQPQEPLDGSEKAAVDLEDDWDAEFDVTDEDVVKLAPSSDVKSDASKDEDWESWD